MDPWLGPNIILRDLIESPLPQNELTSIIAFYISNTSINLTQFLFGMPSNVHKLLSGIHIPTLTNNISYDQLYWGSRQMVISLLSPSITNCTTHSKFFFQMVMETYTTTKN